MTHLSTSEIARLAQTYQEIADERHSNYSWRRHPFLAGLAFGLVIIALWSCVAVVVILILGWLA